jgi:outer membrane protein TolC
MFLQYKMTLIHYLTCSLLFLLTSTLTLSAQEQTELPASWTVREAVAFALRNNPDTMIAKQRLGGARAAVDLARVGYYPRFDIGAEYAQTDNPMYSFGNILNQGVFSPEINFNDPGRTDNLRLEAKLLYRFYNGGQDHAGVAAARANESAKQWALQTVHNTLAFQVVHSFHTIIQAEEMVQARQSAIAAITASVKVAHARHEAGDLLQTDLLNLEVQLSRAREELIRTRHRLNLAKRGLLNLLGLEQGQITIDPLTGIGQALPDKQDFSSRPELQQIEAGITAAEAALEKARGGYYPRVDGVAGYQVDKGFEHDGSGDSWLAAVRVNYNLFDGNNTSAAVAKAKADLGALRAEQRKIHLAIELEVKKADLNLQQAEERLQVTDKMVEQAMESARLSRERFTEGLVLSSDVIDVENRLTDALVNHSLAKGDRCIAVADLRRALGLEQFPDNRDNEENK